MSEAGESDPERQAETRHKIANIFQLLSTLTRMRLQRAEEPQSRRHLSWILDMVTALGVLQHRLNSPGGDDFGLYIQDMAGQWRRGCAGRPIEIVLVVQPLRIPENHASALALIVNELVMNAIAHGFPDERSGKIRIELEQLGARAALTVSDDGQGYDPRAVETGRLGLWLVNGLAAQVRGALTTTCDNGVRSRLEFPVVGRPV
ncbi:MAG TPA: sensor histidine kinase [Caulobacteraceae bacterium]